MTGEPIRPQPKAPPRKARPRKPLRRKRYMRKRTPRRLSRAGSDPAYLAWVRTQDCAVRSYRCFGRIHAHHAGRRPGVAMKADDSTAIPLCMHHHECWHRGLGPFSHLSKLQRFVWASRAIAHTLAAYEGRDR